MEGSLSARWEAIPKITPNLGIAEHEVMFMVKGTAIFLYRTAVRLQSLQQQAQIPIVSACSFWGSCMGVVLMQKGILALHGSSLVLDNKAYALVGRSGAGKSTLASYLMDQGHLLVSDDVIPVLVHNGHPLAVPGYPQQKLWQQSLDYLGMNSSAYRPLFQRETKFAVPVHDRFQSEPLPLAGIFELSVVQDGPVAVEAISGLGRLHTLYNHTYQKALVDPMGVREWHFGLLASFVNRLPMYRLTRPEQGFSAPQQRELIMETIMPKVKEMNL